MNESVAKDVAQLLVDNAVATSATPTVLLTLGTNLFVFEWGEDIDEQILINDAGGLPSDLKDQYENPIFQILSRGPKAEGGIIPYNNLKIVRDFLLTQPELVTINTTDYLGFEEQSNMAPLGNDENDRFIYVMNFFTFRNSI